MLGIVFTELLDMAEARFSPATVDRVLTRANLPHGGAYTAVGYYPHEEIVGLVGLLSEETGLSSRDLVRAFGEHLFARFVERFPGMFDGHGDVHAFLAALDGVIHREVRKLYPNAMLPRFTVLDRTPERMTLRYESPRRMEVLAEGLIAGAIAHFGGGHRVSFREDGEAVLFEIERAPVPARLAADV